MTKDEYIALYEKYLAGQCTPEEEYALFSYHEEFDLNGNQWENESMGHEEEVKRTVWLRLKKTMLPRRIWLYTAASVAAMLVLIAGYIFLIPGHQHPVTAANKNQPSNTPKVYTADVAPGGNKAILTLANGSIVTLDDMKVGTTARIGSLDIHKTKGGQLSYSVNPDSMHTQTVQFNTLTTPKGGQYEVVLADGTKVFLNAASSLRFPTAFTGTERNVELTGEGYFEVAKNKAMPFKVKVGDMTVAVLGTHFNIMAYEGEKWVKTTLLEGSVRLTSGSASTMLKPGEQARLTNSGSLNVVRVNTAEEVAWKDGYFAFNNTDIQTVMRQMSRWYDVEVQYSGAVPNDEFVGKISRSSKLSEVLRTLELTGVHFRMENKKIIILPQ